MPFPPIDYDKIRIALAETMQSALGLPSNNVVQLQSEVSPAPRPHAPFATFQLTGLGASFGRDSLGEDADESWRYFGPRMLTAAFQFYGDTHEQAYGLAAQWQSALDEDPTQELLMQKGGISVWRREAPMDISAMMFTGFEGRASMNCTFGVQALSTVNMNRIEEVPVSGQVGSDGTITVTITDGEG
jgi:hypothetical protein